MQSQISIFDIFDEPSIKWIEITKKPSITWLHDNASMAFNSMCDLDEKAFIKVWKAVGIANYMFKRGIEPKGFIHRRHHHIIHQIGADDQVKKVKNEFMNRRLDSRIGLDICFVK